MQINDLVIEAINDGAIDATVISFDRLRWLAGRDNDCWSELDRGRGILTSSRQLDQYLYSYGPMTKSQWNEFLKDVERPSGPIRLVDYGCGQGLACALLFDYFGSDFVSQVKEIILIEPSVLALDRAIAIVSCYCKDAKVSNINKKLDDLPSNYILSSASFTTVHLFSNVLDIDDFNYAALFNKLFKVIGYHSVFAVSHDRAFKGGSERIEDLDRQIRDPQYVNDYSLSRCNVSRFTCMNKQPAISWQLQVKVLRELV